MVLTERRRFIRVSVAGRVVRTGPDVTITESIDALCTVAEFALAAMPSPEIAVGDDVLIEWIEIHTTTTSTPLFGGSISALDVESEPWVLLVRCVDQLERLRKIKNGGDMVFGEPDGSPSLTEGEAVMALLDYCGIDYDDFDIADSGYVLGEQVRVSWLADSTTNAGSVVAELNRVFRMALYTIGNNRVVRIPYDSTPDNATGLYETYTKGSDISFAAHHRTYGDRDRVQNVWVVRGVTREDANGNCSRTVWARAEDGGLLVGTSRRARVATQEFQSDFIQDEGLAEAIVRSLMAETNRLADDGSATLENDPNVHPTSKVAVVDSTYGIRANPRYYLVRSVTRNGVTMSLDLSAGPGGPPGTVTHGVDKVCTDVHSTGDWPGSFDFPASDFPPLLTPDPITLDPLTPPGLITPGFDVIGGEPDSLETLSCDSTSFVAGLPIEEGDWQISGFVELTGASQRLTIGVTSGDGDYRLTIAGPGYYAGISSPPLRYELASPESVRSASGTTPLDTDILWLIRWTSATSTLICQLSYGDVVIDDILIASGADMTGAVTSVSLGGTPSRTGEIILHNCGGDGGGGAPGTTGCFDPVESMWETGAYSVSFDPVGSKINLVDGSESPEIILLDGASPRLFTATERLTWTLNVDFTSAGTGSDVPLASFILQQNISPFAFAGVQVEWYPSGEGYIYFYTITGFHQHTFTAVDVYAGFDLRVTWDPVANTVSYTYINESYSLTQTLPYGVVAMKDMVLKMNWTSATAIELLTEQNRMCLGAESGVVLTANWVDDASAEGSHTFGDGSDHVTGTAAAHNTTYSRTTGQSWTLTAIVVIDAGHSTEIKMGVDGLANEYYALIYSTAAGGGLEVGSLNDTTSNATNLTGQTVTVTLSFDASAHVLSATFDGSGSPITITTPTDEASYPPSLPLSPSLRVYEETPGGGATIDAMTLT